MLNLPIVITFSRILLIPLFIFVVGTRPLLGAIIFLAAALTDILDGYIARRSKQVTKLGVLLDPVADKLLVISALVVFVDLELIKAWIAIVIIVREFFVTGLRIVAVSKDILIPAETGGKIKTVTQITSIIVLLVDKANISTGYSLFYSFLHLIKSLIENLFSMDLYGIGIILLWVAMIIGVISGVQYIVIFWRRLR